MIARWKKGSRRGDADFEKIALDQRHVVRESRTEAFNQVPIDLDSDHPCHGWRQLQREGSSTRTDLDEELIASRPNRGYDLLNPRRLKKMLTEALSNLRH